jgi:hypothetical protein
MNTLRPNGLPVPLGGVVTDPDGVRYGVASISGDQVKLRCWDGGDQHWEIIATKGLPVRSGNRDIVVTGVLTEEGKRPWIVIGSA